MTGRGFWDLNDISDAALEGNLRQLIASGSRTEARIVAHIAEVEARRLHLREGYESLFEYCKKHLDLSENEAFYRITAARMAAQFPLIFGLLAKREVFLTTLPLIRDYLSPDNHQELLEAIRGKSKPQILELLATMAPRPDARSHIRKLPTTPRSVAAGPTGTLEPLSSHSYRLQLNTGHALKEKLELARDLMSHTNPSGDLAVVIERGLDLLIARLRARRFGHVARPRTANAKPHDPTAPRQATPSPTKPHDPTPPHPTRATPNPTEPRNPTLTPPAHPAHFDRSKSMTHATAGAAAGARTSTGPINRRTPSTVSRPHISHEVRRQLIARDGLRCTFTSETGKRCEARGFLQAHHEHAWAHGGSDTIDNLRLLCAHHNQLLAERDFGAERIQSAVRSSRRRAG